MLVRIEIDLITARYEGPCQVRIWAYISFMRDFFTILITLHLEKVSFSRTKLLDLGPF